VTLDVLHLPAVRRAAAVMLAALPLAAALGTLLGGSLFRRRLSALGRLEAAVAGTAADAGASIDVPAGTREIATLQDAFNGLLARLGEALSRERRFTQEAAHELRTPLATLRARLEPMAASEPRAAQALDDVDALDRLVDTLLLLARSESAPLPATPVNLCDLARDAAQRRFLTDGERSRRPEVDAPDEILVRGSEDLLARALCNLVDNARKFGGPQARIVIRVREEGPRAFVSVADDGPGIPAGSVERVFERFFRGADVRPNVDGSGLGLAVVRAIATRHQGTVEARASTLGGAELLLELPALR
jgi:signal transduction histidine kinase